MKIGDKTFLNLQEAVAWLLENNALPYQSTTNYVANTEIAMSTLVNPSPAKVRVGSLIFFADSKVATVIGVTSNSFMVGDQYNNLVDDIAYVTGVAINASGHLITTLSDGQTIDAGIVKQVAGFSINASQHLIVSYNDGSTTDLGAIFSGNINISGTLNATKVTGDEIVETMTGYSVTLPTSSVNASVNSIYVGVSKTGNKITFVIFASITKLTSTVVALYYNFEIPSAVGDKLYTYQIGGYDYLDNNDVTGVQKSDFVRKQVGYSVTKPSYHSVSFAITTEGLTQNEETYVRIEKTFLLSDNMAI